jgi:hypothetical protein
MKYRILLSLFCSLGCYSAFSFSDSTITPKDFKNLIGCWQGSLTYLDYTTGKPFSMPANIMVKDFKDANNIIYSMTYPEEPKANSVDTLFISKDGRLLNNEPIKSNRLINKDSTEVVTEITGVDGNDHRAAIIRHTYMLGKDTYSVKKEVQFGGESRWIVRHEYRFSRTKPCTN